MDDIKKLKQLEKQKSYYYNIGKPVAYFWLAVTVCLAEMFLVLALR